MCVFCKINQKEIPSYQIYEDEYVNVIMDINPSQNGHLLVIPKKHHDDFYTLDDYLSKHINKVAKEMVDLLKRSLNSDGFTILHNYGITQEVKHFHLHIIPSNEKKQELEEVENIHKKIRSVL